MYIPTYLSLNNHQTTSSTHFLLLFSPHPSTYHFTIPILDIDGSSSAKKTTLTGILPTVLAVVYRTIMLVTTPVFVNS